MTCLRGREQTVHKTPPVGLQVGDRKGLVMKKDTAENLLFKTHKVIQLARECYQKRYKLSDAELNEGVARIETLELYLSTILKRIE
jgi:hypothetical protein